MANDWKAARPLVWSFNIFGTVDLFVAITLGATYQASISMGATYWIPALWVPAMLVTHYLTFIVLRKHWFNETAPSSLPLPAMRSLRDKRQAR